MCVIQKSEQAIRCPQALRSVGPYVVEKFCEIVKLRNQLARLAGFEVSYGSRPAS